MSLQKIEEYGVIGAGGAGFPTHVKLDSKPDTVIMNAAECEPLLHKDMEIILHYADEVLAGFRKIIEITGAKQGLIGIKEKHHHEIELLNSKVSGNIKKGIGKILFSSEISQTYWRRVICCIREKQDNNPYSFRAYSKVY